MGGLCSKQAPATNPYAGKSMDLEKQYQQRQQVQRNNSSKIVTAQTTVQDSMEKPVAAKESPRRLSARYSNVSDDEFYDGIPRYQKSLYQKSRSSRSAKVSEVGSILSRAGSVGLGRAVEVLDTLGSSVTNLNLKGGFASGAASKNNELSILGFEVANTIVKGSSLMQSLSNRSIRQLKEVVLLDEGVQKLISNDMEELLRIVASDKREELKVFAGEVIRFGNRCKDPQWHNLDRFFEKRSRNRTPQNQLREKAETVMLQLMTSVQLTAELYQELHVLDKLEQEYQRKSLEIRFNAGQRGDRDNSLNVLSSEMKGQKKIVKNLKKKSLWSRSMEEVMEKLVDTVLFLNQEINHTFGNPDESETPEKGIISNQQKLGPAGLALHYANIILLIDAIVARPSSMPPDTRETLYQSLPPKIRDALRSKLQSFHVEKEMTVTEIKAEMEKTLHWLVLVATNTAKAHHGFGWVGEWVNTGSESNHRTVRPIDVMQIETLHHANKQTTEAYILDLLTWLSYLVTQCKSKANNGGRGVRRSVRSPARSPSKESNQQRSSEPLLQESNAGKPDDSESAPIDERASSNASTAHGLGNDKLLDVADKNVETPHPDKNVETPE